MKDAAAVSIADPDCLPDELPEFLESRPELRSEMLYKMVALSRPKCIGIVPEECMNETLAMQALTVSVTKRCVKETLAAIPERFRTDRVCLHALACSSLSLNGSAPESDLCTPASIEAWNDICASAEAAESEEESAGPRP